MGAAASSTLVGGCREVMALAQSWDNGTRQDTDPLITDEERRAQDEERRAQERQQTKRFLKELPGLPAGRYPKQVKLIADDYAEAAEALPLGAVAGQVIPLQFIALAVRIGFFPCFAALAYQTATCDAQNSSLATYNGMIWLSLVPVVVACMGLEYICHWYTIIPIYQTVKNFYAFNCKTNYTCMFITAVLISLLSFSDIACDSAFIGLYLKGDSCQEDILETTWHEFLEEAYGDCLYWAPSLSILVWIAWCTTIVDIFCVLLTVVPSMGDFCKVDYEVSDSDRRHAVGPTGMVRLEVQVDYEESDSDRRHASTGIVTGIVMTTEYKNNLCQAMNHGRALFALAWCNNATLVTIMATQYALGRAKDQYQARDTCVKLSDWPKPPCTDYLEHAEHLFSLGLSQTCLRGLLNNVFQLFVQISVMEVRMYALPDVSWKVRLQSRISFVLGALVAIIHLFENWRRASSAGEWIGKGEAMVEKLEGWKNDLEAFKARLPEYNDVDTLRQAAEGVGVGCPRPSNMGQSTFVDLERTAIFGDLEKAIEKVDEAITQTVNKIACLRKWQFAFHVALFLTSVAVLICVGKILALFAICDDGQKVWTLKSGCIGK